MDPPTHQSELRRLIKMTGALERNSPSLHNLFFTSCYLRGTKTRLTRPARNKKSACYFFQGEIETILGTFSEAHE